MAKEIEAIKRFHFETEDELIEYFKELDIMQMNDEKREILINKYGLEHPSQIGGVWYNSWGGWLLEITYEDYRGFNGADEKKLNDNEAFFLSRTYSERGKKPRSMVRKEFFEEFSLDEIYLMVLPKEEDNDETSDED